MSKVLDNAFQTWKIWLAILLGVGISTFLVVRSLNETQFVESTDGTHIWVDANQNGIVDFQQEEEFIPQVGGAYEKAAIKDSLSKLNWTSTSFIWLGVALLFMISRDFFYMVRIRLLTKQQLNWRSAFYVIMIWEFASALSPGVVGGAAVAMFILNRETIPFGKATAIVIITAFMDNLFYVVMIPFVFLFIRVGDMIPSGDLFLGWWFWVGFGLILFICGLLYLTIFWFPNLATRFLMFVFRLPFLKRWKFIAAEWGKDIETASKEFKEEPFGFWLKVFASTFASWISRYLVINAILATFIQLGILDHILVLAKQFILWLFMLVSPTPGGSGVAEFAFSELFSSLSASGIIISVSVVLWRLISYFPYLFIGAIVLPAWIKRTRS